jgi:hypothetical protein
MIFGPRGQKLSLNSIYSFLNFNFAPIGSNRHRDCRSGVRLATAVPIELGLTIGQLQILSVLRLMIGI